MGRVALARSRTRSLRGIHFAASALLAASIAASPAAAAPRPGFDASASLRPSPAVLAELARARADRAIAVMGTATHLDERYGVPNFFQATPSASARAKPAPSPGREQAARDHLIRLAPQYRLDADDVRGAVLRDVHDTGVGGIIVTLEQQVDGIDVFRDQVKVLVDRNLDLLAVTGYIPGRAEARGGEARTFRLSAMDAISRALEDFSGTAVARGAIRFDRAAPGGYEWFEVTGTVAGNGWDPIRAKRVLFHLPDDLVPGWYIEVMAGDGAAGYVISARDGGLLFRSDMTCSAAYSYRVWGDAAGVPYPSDGPQGTAASPHPTGLPDFFAPGFVAPSLITVQNGPISTNDPWLPPGATQLTGNHVDAFAELVAPLGFSAGDLRATNTGPNAFDHLYDTGLPANASSTQRMAGITEAFYLCNFMHDWFYDVGFNEAARNTQMSNYGRGGLEGDPLVVKTQTYNAPNNAFLNFTADGASPTMTVGVAMLAPLQALIVHSPSSIAGSKTVGTANSNATQFSVTGDIVLPNPNSYSIQGSSTLACGVGPQWVTFADLNNDGAPDLATANYLTNNVSVLLNQGGGFAAKVDYVMGVGPYTVEARDLNGDGWRDLICANFQSGTFSVRLGTGDGLFGSKTDFVVGPGTTIATVGRFNADAYDDVVTASYSSSTVSVFLGDGTGSFAPKVDYPAGANPNWVAVADVNGDGVSDLVTANLGASTVSVLNGTGLGTFQSKVDFPVGAAPVTLSLGDLNGDAKPDIVTANANTNTLKVLLNNGSGGFTAGSAYPVDPAPITVTLSEVNGDGLLDATVCSDASNTVSVLLGNGAGGFGASTFTVGVGATPYGVAVGDVNGDSYPDLVSANYGSNDVSLRLGLITDAAQQCAPFGNALTGRIALIDGPSCTIDSKITAAEAAGAVGVVIISGTVAVNLPVSQPHGIPAYCIGFTDAEQIRSALRTGPVHASMVNQPALTRDMALDNQCVAHEWVHQMSTRLVGNASGLVNFQGRQMGEGWSDFGALLVTIRPEDAASNFAGVYAIPGFSRDHSVAPDNAYYFGWRRYPYSTDMSRNPLTFIHIQRGVPLPTGPPVAPNGAVNDEDHNAGEVWCTMLLECYASLLRDASRLTFAQARDRMRQYLVAGMKLTPLSPTFVEARDALLAAALANDLVDYQSFCAAFARRGMGTSARAPDRNAFANPGVVESFGCGGAQFLSATLDPEFKACDADGVSDQGERGRIVLRFRNGGPTPFTNAFVGVTCSSPNVSYPNGAMQAVGALPPGASDSVTVIYQVSGNTGIENGSFTPQATGDGFAEPIQSGAPLAVVFNRDIGPEGEIPEPSICTPLDVEPAASRPLSFARRGTHPAHGSTSFEFALPRPASVRLAIFDVAGRHVATLAEGFYAAGAHVVPWHASGRAGLYLARFQALDETRVIRTIVLR